MRIHDLKGVYNFIVFSSLRVVDCHSKVGGMKFSLKSTNGTGRLGLITNVARLKDFEMETPHALLYTEDGTVSHLTHDVLQRVSNQKLGLHISVPYITYLENRLKNVKFTIADFIGMKEYLTYCSFVDPGKKRKSGFHEKEKISFWTRNGRKMYSAESYMKLIENLKPDMFVTLADGDTEMNSSKKRTAKAVNLSESLFLECMERYKKSEILKDSKIIGALEGGFNENLRENFSELIGNSSVSGVVIDGLHDCSNNVLEMNSKNIKPMVEASLKHIPDDKLRIINGSWNPSVMLDLIELGVDLFDTSFPYYITEQGGALTFPNDEKLLDQYVVNGVAEPTKNENHVNGTGNVLENEKSEEPASKRLKLEVKSIYHVSMTNPIYLTDFSPILKHCTCYTCKNHTRSYIRHLINVEELLSSTLLMVHNLHHYLQFLSTIRTTLKSGTFKQFKNCFQNWVEKMNKNSSPP